MTFPIAADRWACLNARRHEGDVIHQGDHQREADRWAYLNARRHEEDVIHQGDHRREADRWACPNARLLERDEHPRDETVENR